MTISDQNQLLEWIDQFVFDHYYPPTLADVIESGIRIDLRLLEQERRELVESGDLLPSPVHFIPAWLRDFVDFRAHKSPGYQKILKAVRYGHH